MLTWPLLRSLEGAKRVLIAGAGGGFDLLSGLPLALTLEDQGSEVHLANLSFTPFAPAQQASIQRGGPLWVDADSPSLAAYAPERDLCRWYRAALGREERVCIVPRGGYEPVLATYRALVAELALDAVVLVDGGTDSLMRGDEETLGTPEEDLSSLVAVADLEGVERKALVCLGFGVDAYHGVCGAHVLQATAELSRAGGYLGALALVEGMEPVDRYLAAVAWVQERTAPQSIVCASVSDAIRGHYGDHHSTSRTAGGELYINPLMGLYWAYELGAVIRRGLYAEAVRGTRGWGEVRIALQDMRRSLPGLRGWEIIPH